VSVFKKEHIELLRQYFLSDNSGVKNKILESFPAELRKKVLLIQNEFENNTDAKSITSQINVQEFEKELEEIQSAFYLKRIGLLNQEFEKELIGAIKPIEREKLKKQLIAFEEMSGEELSDVELKSAITLVERAYLKKKLKSLEDPSKGKVIPFGLQQRPAAAPSTRTISINSILKFAVAACFIFALGFGVYQFTKQNVIQENTLSSSSEEKETDQLPEDIQEIETIPLAEVSIESNSLVVLKSGLGFAETEEKIMVVENNQQQRILSIQKAFSAYQRQLDNAKESGNPAGVQITKELQNRIASLQEELQALNISENLYLFDGQKLTIFSSSSGKENQILAYDTSYYMKKDSKFFRLSISKEPQLFQEEINPNVQKALDKILFNAE